LVAREIVRLRRLEADIRDCQMFLAITDKPTVHKFVVHQFVVVQAGKLHLVNRRRSCGPSTAIPSEPAGAIA
jgi:hypothetical protein